MFKKILFAFLTWRVALFLIAFLSIYLLPVFGARFPYADRVLEITHLPNWVWGFGNFDGVHYLRIAQDGYFAQYSQAFFPLFPILIRIFSFIFPRVQSLDISIFTDPAYFYSGIILSNAFFLGALYVLYKLINIDFKKDIAFLSMIVLLTLPTSFFFGSIYTESLFLLLAVSAIYLTRKGHFFWAAVLISLSTATRITGVLLIPLFLIEAFQSKRKINYTWTLITPIGILAYMFYLKVSFGDALYFLTSQPAFGAGRIGNGIILLPQVIYRYAKIFLTTKILTLPFFNAFLEFAATLVPLSLLLTYIKKMRLSYWVFSISALLLGTLTGTLSSMPRYALISVIFLLPLMVSRFRKIAIPFAIVSAVLEAVLLMLFIRGYWIA
jgi:hypothetical protein